MTVRNLATQERKAIARPLRILVPLIKEDLRHGDDAAKSASMPYYCAAGEKMIEAKSQLAHGEFQPWIKRNFRIGFAQANLYMSYARATGGKQSSLPGNFSSMDDFKRRHLGYKGVIPGSQRDKDWHEPVKKIMGRVDLEALRDTELKRAEERDAERKLALQLIDIGYKTLATKLHPDKGGSRDAMRRLNTVRDRLKAHA